MPQRAIIEEDSGEREVHAFQLTDQQWIGVIEASKAGVLKLPCCGQSALARNPHGMIRHFAHPPYTLENCDAKSPDAMRDYIIVQVAQMAEHLGWTVVTEEKVANCFCDLVCQHKEYGFHIGIEIETGHRDNDELLNLDRDLKSNGITLVQWFFKKGRRGGYPSVTHQHVCSMQEKQQASKRITDECRKLLSNIDSLFDIAEQVCDGLEREGLEHELHNKAGLPDHVIVKFKEGQETHRIDLSSSKVKMTNPTVAINRHNIARGETVGQQQETLIAIIYKNLAAGVAVWWDGHPALLSDSFRRLRADIELEDSRRKEYQARLQTEYDAQSQNTTDHSANQRGEDAGQRQYRQSPVFTGSTSEVNSYTDFRLKEAQCILQAYYGENYSNDILDTPLVELEGQTPRQLATGTSQSTERLQIVLGYRDPITKRPLKPLPDIKL